MCTGEVVNAFIKNARINSGNNQSNKCLLTMYPPLLKTVASIDWGQSSNTLLICLQLQLFYCQF